MRTALALLLFVIALPLAPSRPAQAADEQVLVPNYWDTRRKPEKSEATSIRVIRFLTDSEYPPFHYANPDGTLTGFSVDLARAICTEMRIACTIQARRWDTLAEALSEGRGDAIVAAMRITPELRQRFQITAPYHRSPARFVAKKGATLPDPSRDGLRDRSVGVVSGSAHEAYIRDFFPGAKRTSFGNPEAAFTALKRGEVEFVFADGVTIALWLNGSDSADCCAFRGGPYLESRYFGEGVGILVRKEDGNLRKALDQALVALAEKGTYADLYLRYFPVSFY